MNRTRELEQPLLSVASTSIATVMQSRGLRPEHRPGLRPVHRWIGVPVRSLSTPGGVWTVPATLQCAYPVADQPRQHGRIAIVDKLTIRRWLVPHRLNPDNATVLDEHCGTTGAEILTIKGVVCTDREHIAWLPNPAARVNASQLRNQHEASELRLREERDWPACTPTLGL